MDESGLATLASRSRLGGAAPVKAHRRRIHRAMAPEDAFRFLLSECLSQLNASAGAVRAGRSVESLHQLRVALRRLEVALASFGKAFQQEWIEELSGRAKLLSGRLGPARDLDVFRSELLAEEDEKGLLRTLKMRLEVLRNRAWREAQECARGPDFGLLVDDVTALAQSRLPLAPAANLTKVAGKLLDRQWARAQGHAKKARQGGDAELHRFRISLKKLRYLTEFFGELYPRRKVRRAQKRMRKLQEYLGAINDIARIGAAMAAFSGDSDRTAAALLAGRHRRRRSRLRKKTFKRWKKFRAVTPFWV